MRSKNKELGAGGVAKAGREGSGTCWSLWRAITSSPWGSPCPRGAGAERRQRGPGSALGFERRTRVKAKHFSRGWAVPKVFPSMGSCFWSALPTAGAGPVRRCWCLLEITRSCVGPHRYLYTNYVSRILQYLSTCAVGATLENQDEEEGDENGSDAELPPREVYEIVGTLSKPESATPPFAQETYAVSMSLISDCL